MSPFTHMRVALGAFREMEVPFTSAWTRAIQTLPREVAGYDQTLLELKAGRDWWRAAYERRDHEALAKPVSEPVLAFVAAALGVSEGDGALGAPDTARDSESVPTIPA